MWPYAAAVIAGAVLAGRSKPKTKVRKLECLGPRTGMTYHVDHFPDAGFIVVYSDCGKATGTFQPQGKHGYVLVKCKGKPAAIRRMRADFEQRLSNGHKNRNP